MGLLRRPVQQLRRRPQPLRRAEQPVLRHLQRLPVLDFDHDERRGPRGAHQGHHRPLRRHRSAGGSRPSRSSSRAAWSTGTRRRRSGTSSRASRRRSSTSSRQPRALGATRPSSSRPTRAAATTTQATSQPVDFFGDGTRIPMIAVSKYSKGGHVSHEYTDHVSILKFIERTGLAAGHEPQPRQPAQPAADGQESVRARQRPGDRRPVRHVRLRQVRREDLHEAPSPGSPEGGASRAGGPPDSVLTRASRAFTRASAGPSRAGSRPSSPA